MEKLKVVNIYGNYIYQEFFLDLLESSQAYETYYKSMDGEQIKTYFHGLGQAMLSSLVEYLIERNQYIYIDKDFEAGLKKIYNRHILIMLKEFTNNQGQNLKQVLDQFNQDILSYLNKFEEIRKLEKLGEDIANFQYSPKEQIRILGLNNPVEDILDLGCGKDHSLVSYLRAQGLRTFGLDRYNFQEDYLFTGSWLDFSYGENKYGTIVAHMSFSNHFIRENLKLDGLHKEYARAYMEILKSLKVGGSFYYSPSLEFIEKFLDREKYRLSYGQIGLDYKSVKITRIKE